MKLLVIVVEALQAGYLGCYGNEWIATPALDQIAAEGAVFDQHHADCPDAEAARRAWRFGCHALPALAETDPALTDDTIDLLRLLQEGGIATALAQPPGRPASFAQGWGHVETIPPRGEGTLLERSLEAALNCLDVLQDQDNWLLWLDMPTLVPPWKLPREFRDRYLETDDADAEPLEPWTGPVAGFVAENDEETWARLQRTYAAAVTYLDTGLGMLREELERRGLGGDLGLIVTSDRGLALGEHGLLGDYRPWLHAERLHLPLLLRLPDLALAGYRVAALTQPVDLMPTVLELFGLAAPPVHGHSLLPLLRGDIPAVRPYAVAGQRLGEALEFALRTPDWALVLPVLPGAGDPPRAAQLFVKPDDRWEVNDVRQHHLDLVDRLEATIHAFVTATHRPGPLHPPPLRDEEAAAPAEGASS